MTSPLGQTRAPATPAAASTSRRRAGRSPGAGTRRPVRGDDDRLGELGTGDLPRRRRRTASRSPPSRPGRDTAVRTTMAAPTMAASTTKRDDEPEAVRAAALRAGLRCGISTASGLISGGSHPTGPAASRRKHDRAGWRPGISGVAPEIDRRRRSSEPTAPRRRRRCRAGRASLHGSSGARLRIGSPPAMDESDSSPSPSRLSDRTRDGILAGSTAGRLPAIGGAGERRDVAEVETQRDGLIVAAGSTRIVDVGGGAERSRRRWRACGAGASSAVRCGADGRLVRAGSRVDDGLPGQGRQDARPFALGRTHQRQHRHR